MLSKKHNDSMHWKNKLEALDSLPEVVATDKNAMWDKLHNRLQQKQDSSKAVWYWVAAGLLPLVIITLTMIKSTGNVLVEQTTAKEKNTKTNQILLLPAFKESVTVYTNSTAEKKQPLKPVSATLKNKMEVTIKTTPAVISSAALQENQEAAMTVNSLPVDTTLTVATAAITKKKLQVVHINELETFPAQFSEPVNYAKNLSGIKTRKNKINNLSLTTQQNIIGFKINLSSKN